LTEPAHQAFIGSRLRKAFAVAIGICLGYFVVAGALLALDRLRPHRRV